MIMAPVKRRKYLVISRVWPGVATDHAIGDSVSWALHNFFFPVEVDDHDEETDGT